MSQYSLPAVVVIDAAAVCYAHSFHYFWFASNLPLVVLVLLSVMIQAAGLNMRVTTNGDSVQAAGGSLL